MEIRSKTIGVVIAIVIFGGIIGVSILGFWKPTLSKYSVNIQANQSTGIYDPAEIRDIPVHAVDVVRDHQCIVCLEFTSEANCPVENTVTFSTKGGR